MTLWRWTCAACGQSHDSERAPLPIVCRCGRVDATGSGLVALEPSAADPPVLPPLPVRVRHLSTAAAKWVAAGSPTRSDDQAHEIYRRHCARPCEWLVGDTCRHPACGCRVVDPRAVSPDTPRLVDLVTSGLWNKLKWATETCPAGYWS